jgi:hypothetical protein
VPLLGTSHSSIACSCPWARSAPAAQHLHTPPPSARHCAHACATRSASLTFALAPPANRSSAHSPALHRCELLHCQLCRSRVCVTPAHRQLAGHARVCSWIAPAPCGCTHAAVVSLRLWPLAPTRRSRAACAKPSHSQCPFAPAPATAACSPPWLPRTCTPSAPTAHTPPLRPLHALARLGHRQPAPLALPGRTPLGPSRRQPLLSCALTAPAPASALRRLPFGPSRAATVRAT